MSASREPVSWVRSDGLSETTIYFDFDNDFLSLHTTRAIQRVADDFQRTRASAIEVWAFRGSSRLSKGTEMVERPEIADLRAVKVKNILEGLGVPRNSVNIRLQNEYRKPDGIADPWSRKITLSIKP